MRCSMNKRSTIQRSLVLQAVKELHFHVTADEIYDAIVKNTPISAEQLYIEI